LWDRNISAQIHQVTGPRTIARGPHYAGAEHFLSKPFREQELLDAVTEALQKEGSRRERLCRLAAVRDCFRSLTPRESEVMAHAASGLTNKEIAAAVCISVVTVKVHRCQAMRKMRARSFADLVLLAKTLGLVLLPSESEADEQLPSGCRLDSLEPQP
jgi:FixJ family two-component response regulator